MLNQQKFQSQDQNHFQVQTQNQKNQNFCEIGLFRDEIKAWCVGTWVQAETS